MTTIAVRDGIMAADSAIVDGGICVGSVPKLHRISCGVMGGAGKWSEVLMFRDWLDECGPDPKTFPDKIRDTDTSVLLLCKDGRLLCLEGRSQWEIDAPYQAIGTGFQIALGAMAAGASAERAVEIACDLDVNARRPVIVVKAAED